MARICRPSTLDDPPSLTKFPGFWYSEAVAVDVLISLEKIVEGLLTVVVASVRQECVSYGLSLFYLVLCVVVREKGRARKMW